VRPVKVNVTQLPEFSSFTTFASSCEGTTGKIIASSSLTGESYTINGGTPQATGNFFNLAPGFYTVTLQALNGCSIDSIVEVGSVISTNAHFTANPAQGNAPLMVNFSNQSTNANNYEWLLNGVSQGNNYTSELFDSIGIYTVQLIAWQNDPTCADTAFQTISVSSAGFYILGSSLVSASSNSQNTFSVLTNGTPIVKVTLYDAQGRLLKTKTNLLLIAGSNTIWSASELSDIASEMVLYRIEWQNAAESGELKGKVLFLK
jgi:PKD repeat protein